MELVRRSSGTKSIVDHKHDNDKDDDDDDSYYHHLSCHILLSEKSLDDSSYKLDTKRFNDIRT